MLLFQKQTLLDTDKTESNLVKNAIFMFKKSVFVYFLMMCLFNFLVKVW